MSRNIFLPQGTLFAMNIHRKISRNTPTKMTDKYLLNFKNEKKMLFKLKALSLKDMNLRFHKWFIHFYCRINCY